MTSQETKDKVFAELDLWKNTFNVTDLDVLIATPPCQGMSVANHKKKDELKRNSLVVESIKMVDAIKPKFFIIENVRAFLKSICTDVDGKDKVIKEAINWSRRWCNNQLPWRLLSWPANHLPLCQQPVGTHVYAQPGEGGEKRKILR